MLTSRPTITPTCYSPCSCCYQLSAGPASAFLARCSKLSPTLLWTSLLPGDATAGKNIPRSPFQSRHKTTNLLQPQGPRSARRGSNLRVWYPTIPSHPLTCYKPILLAKPYRQTKVELPFSNLCPSKSSIPDALSSWKPPLITKQATLSPSSEQPGSYSHIAHIALH